MPNRPETSAQIPSPPPDDDSVLPTHGASDITPALTSRIPLSNRFRSGTPVGTGGRVLLVVVGLLLVAGFGLSAWLSPDPSGHGTHQQLGLAPCSFLLLTGRPCPSCGGTTAFAHFVRGEWPSAVRANAAAFVLALLSAAMIPWCVLSATTGRLIGITHLERTLLIGIVTMTVLFALQWGVNLLTNN